MLTVADRAGLSQQMVSYVEREIRRPTLETALRVAAALNVDLGDLIKAATLDCADPKPRGRKR